MCEGFDDGFEGTRQRQAKQGLRMTHAERLRWLETTREQLRPLRGRARWRRRIAELHSNTTTHASDAARTEEMSPPAAAIEALRSTLGPWGAVKPIIAVPWRGLQCVAVGSELRSGSWKLFTDFLIDYATDVLGPVWLEEESRRDPLDMHPLVSWWRELHNYAEEDGSRVRANAGGIAFLRIAYDLFLLDHHMCESPALVRRLRHRQQFQGARYELFAAATCIKAGCRVIFEDESDGSTKHCEFTAEHESTGQRLSVEAKSTHHPDTQGRARDRRDRTGAPRLGQLLRSALSKLPNFADPGVVFLELNVPRSPELSERDTTINKLRRMVEDVSGDAESWSLLLITNHPEQYDERVSEPASSVAISVHPRNPQRTVAHPEVLHALAYAAGLSGRVPIDFPARTVLNPA